MKRLAWFLVLMPAVATGQEPDFWTRIHATVERNLGRPYVWGTSGLKSFDCSGFVWRVWADNGVPLKRTTARKMYFSLPKVSPKEQGNFGTIVFFDNMKHCGIVNSPRSFYHAQTSKGTNLSDFTPFWRAKVCGYRAIRTTQAPAPR